MTPCNQLRQAKQTLRQYIRRFDDPKLAAVYAFNSDGKMEYANTCSCLRGVASSAVLHHIKCRGDHYFRIGFDPATRCAEHAYLALGWSFEYEFEDYGFAGSAFRDDLRRVRLSAILRAELRRRDRDRAAQRQTATSALRAHAEEPNPLAIALESANRKGF
jgi:hypothetical protein